MLSFDVYLGRVAEPIPNGLGHHVIMKMTNRYLDKGHHVYFDNFFASVKLGQELERRGTYMCSMIRLNRSGWPKEMGGTVAKKMKRGEVLFRQDGNMVATLWKDKRAVAVLSTNSQAKMGTVDRRAPGGKKEVAVPEPVLSYNANMGGVDLADQHHSYYPVCRPSVRWWRYVCWWLMQTAMVNAFIIWKMTNMPASSKKGLRHIHFRLEVLRSLCRGNSVRQQNPRQSISQAGATAADPLLHTIQQYPGRKKNCYLCQKAKIRTKKNYTPQSVWGCLVCQVHLCKGICFSKFHQDLARL